MSDVQIASVAKILRTWTTTSTKIRHIGRPACERGDNSTNLDDDVNEDLALWTSRMPAWRQFYQPRRRRQRRFVTVFVDVNEESPCRTSRLRAWRTLDFQNASVVAILAA